MVDRGREKERERLWDLRGFRRMEEDLRGFYDCLVDRMGERERERDPGIQKVVQRFRRI